MASFNELEVAIHMTLDSLSNGEAVEVKDEWIEEAGEEFKAALRKQFTPNNREFGLRASNIGRPLCQLQNEAMGSPKSRRDYNHIVRMLIGDAVETITRIVLKAAKVNVTGSKSQVRLQVNDTSIPGEDDIEIDGAVWDIKSSAPFAFEHKWKLGWEAVYASDEFGYVGQLYTYAKGKDRPMGGWIVTDKSSGEVLVVPATPSAEQIKQVEENINFKEQALAKNLPFRRGFEEEQETFYKKLTGNKLVPFTCTYCDFIKTCWPNATIQPKAFSEAKNKKPVWYTEFNNSGRD